MNASALEAQKMSLRSSFTVFAAPFRLPVYSACTVVAILTTYLLGKDMAWDTLNYQLYAGFSALNDRFAQDYFPAGPQSYFNPTIYIPFYAMVKADLSSLQIATIFAVAHSVVLWLTFELGMAVCPSEDARTRLMSGICAVALAYMNPILMQQIGSTYADITTAELVLVGWLLLASAIRVARTTRVLFAGLIIGTACALKLTNAVHAIAGFAVLAFLPLPLTGRLRHAIVYGLSLAASFVIVAAPWSYRLEKMFGNPLFPLMNDVFRSPEFTTDSLRHFRFIPDNLLEALWRPFAMLDPFRMVHEELRAPDLRYAVLVALLVAVLCRWAWRQVKGSHGTLPSIDRSSASRTLVALSFGLTVDWILWLGGSGNSRYFIPMSSIAAAVIAGTLFSLLGARVKARNYIFAAIFGVQIIQLWLGTDYRWNGTPWDTKWLSVQIPEKLRTEPNLYLTIGTQSNSFIAPYLSKGAGLINFSGGYALGPEGANGKRVTALIKQYAPHVRVLVRGGQVYEDAEKKEPRRSQVDAALERFSLRVDMTDCVRIVVVGLPHEQVFTLDGSKPVDQPPDDSTYLVSCHLIPDETDHSVLIAQQRQADLVLDRLEDACPKLFQAKRPLTEHHGRAWMRYYMNTDLWAWVSDGWVKYYQSPRGGFRAFVGRESDWAKGPLRVDCRRRDGVYFAKVIESK
jgi:hypothetical protein